MKTRQSSTLWLGLTLACGLLAFAIATSAGKPPKPPPTPTGPTYQIIAVEPFTEPSGINDSGMIVGTWYHDYSTNTGGPFISAFALKPRTANGIQYLAADLVWLPDEGGADDVAEAYGVNNLGQVVGYSWVQGHGRSTLWLTDHSRVNLRDAPVDADSEAYDINEAGMVVVKNISQHTSGVIVPLDLDGNGIAETWFADFDGDGINNLVSPIDLGHGYTPVAINAAGQIALAEGFLLTPDYSDADGDGNPWFADVNHDGVNDLLVSLLRLGDSVKANDVNNTGQVVGSSGGRAVRWDFVNGVQTVTDLGALSASWAGISATGINDSGDIVGTSGNKRGPGPSWLVYKGKMYDLRTLLVNPEGWSDLGAWGINHNGWIFGQGSRTTGGYKAFVAIPVTQP